MFKNSKIYVAGHTGLLGSSLLRKLTEYGFTNIITRNRQELDLTDQRAVDDFFKKNCPEYVFLAAGLTGGILANTRYPADFYHVNISIQDNIFHSAVKYGTMCVVFYGSSCIYPRVCPQPIKEEYLFTGPLEETSEGYAAAKIAGIVASKVYNKQLGKTKFISLVPNTMYGPCDRFSLEDSHVISALIRRFYDAKKEGKKEVTLWGSGLPRREFIYVDDVADASIFAVKNIGRLENIHYNVGTGVDYSIKEIATMIAEIVGYEGKIFWDTSYPDGAPKKLLDSSRFLALGWRPKKSLPDGIKETFKWYILNEGRQREGRRTIYTSR